MLSGTHVILRAPFGEDFTFLFGLRNNLQTQMSLMTWPRGNTAQRVSDWVENNLNDPQRVFFVIASKQDQHPTGYIQITNIDFVSGVGELGICLHGEAQGKGYAQEAMKLLEQYVRSIFRIRKITLRVLASNERAIAFYQKTGFVSVGTYKRHFYQEERFHDVLIMEKFLDSPAEDQA